MYLGQFYLMIYGAQNRLGLGLKNVARYLKIRHEIDSRRKIFGIVKLGKLGKSFLQNQIVQILGLFSSGF